MALFFVRNKQKKIIPPHGANYNNELIKTTLFTLSLLQIPISALNAVNQFLNNGFNGGGGGLAVTKNVDVQKA